MFHSGYSVSLCCSMYCLCVNVHCTTAPACQPDCSKQIYHTSISSLCLHGMYQYKFTFILCKYGFLMVCANSFRVLENVIILTQTDQCQTYQKYLPLAQSPSCSSGNKNMRTQTACRVHYALCEMK